MGNQHAHQSHRHPSRYYASAEFSPASNNTSFESSHAAPDDESCAAAADADEKAAAIGSANLALIAAKKRRQQSRVKKISTTSTRSEKGSLEKPFGSGGPLHLLRLSAELRSSLSQLRRRSVPAEIDKRIAASVDDDEETGEALGSGGVDLFPHCKPWRCEATVKAKVRRLMARARSGIELSSADRSPQSTAQTVVRTTTPPRIEINGKESLDETSDEPRDGEQLVVVPSANQSQKQAPIKADRKKSFCSAENTSKTEMPASPVSNHPPFHYQKKCARQGQRPSIPQHVGRAAISAAQTFDTPDGAAGASSRRAAFVLAAAAAGSGGAFAIRSLDESRRFASLELEMPTLSLRSARSMSPLRAASRSGFFHRSVPSEECTLSLEQGQAIRVSWQRAKAAIAEAAATTETEATGHVNHLNATPGFGHLLFQRVFERAPELRRTFTVGGGSCNGVDAATASSVVAADGDDATSAAEEAAIGRHSRLVTDIIDLAVRNVAELETELGPAMFTYGRRHVHLRTEFTEDAVRLVCKQAIFTVMDLVGSKHFGTAELDAWVEMMTYLGRALLSGFDHERTNGANCNQQNHAAAGAANGAAFWASTTTTSTRPPKKKISLVATFARPHHHSQH